MPGPVGDAAAAAGGGQWTCPLPVPGANASAITGPAGKRSSCLFPLSVLRCLLQGVGEQSWAAGRTPVLGHGRARAARGVRRSGNNSRSPARAAAVARARQSDPLGSRASPDTPSLRFLLSSNAFQVKPEKALPLHRAVSKLALLSPAASVHVAAAAVAARGSAVGGPKATGPHQKTPTLRRASSREVPPLSVRSYQSLNLFGQIARLPSFQRHKAKASWGMTPVRGAKDGRFHFGHAIA